MESKVKEAVQRKMCGYNCAQAVACTYCEQAGRERIRMYWQGQFREEVLLEDLRINCMT